MKWSCLFLSSLYGEQPRPTGRVFVVPPWRQDNAKADPERPDEAGPLLVQVKVESDPVVQVKVEADPDRPELTLDPLLQAVVAPVPMGARR